MDKFLRELERSDLNPEIKYKLSQKYCDHPTSQINIEDMDTYEKPEGRSFYYHCRCGAFVTRYYWLDPEKAKKYMEFMGLKFPLIEVEYS